MPKQIVDLTPSTAHSAPINYPKKNKYADLDWEEININSLDEASAKAASIYGGTAISLPIGVQTPNQVAEAQRREIPEKVPANTGNWSMSLQTLLDQPPSALPRQLLFGGIVFCIAFVTWATFGQIDEIGHARGQLIPKGEVYKIDPVEQGKVANIAIKEGQTVKAGQVLVELDTQIAAGDVERLRLMLASYKMEYSQKQSLLERTRLEAAKQIEIAGADVQAQKAMLAQAQTNVATAQQLLTQLQTQKSEYQVRREKLQPLTAKVQELRQQLEDGVAAEQKRVTMFESLVKDGAVSKNQLLDAQQLLRDRQSALTRNQMDDNSSFKDKLFEAEQALRQNQTDVTKNQGQLEQNLAEINRIQAGLDQKQAQERKTQLEAQQQIQGLEVEMTQLKAKIADTENQIQSATEKLKQRVITAPIDGVITSLNIHNNGEVVQAGKTIAEMAPQDVPMVLTAVLPNQEAGFVKTGMLVQVKLDPYPYQDFGIVTGKVTSISPDAKPDERLGAVYRVEVTLDRDSVTANNKTIHFKAGQTGTAEIIIRQRHISDMLLDPVRQLQKGGITL